MAATNRARENLASSPWVDCMNISAKQYGTLETQNMVKLFRLLMTCLLAPDNFVEEIRKKTIPPTGQISKVVREIDAQVSSR